MRTLLTSLLLLPATLLAQEASFKINNLLSYSFPDYVTTDENLFIANYSGDYYLPAIHKVPLDGSPGITKTFSAPFDYSGFTVGIAKCNLSDHFILVYGSPYADKCLVMKIDQNLNIAWSKLITYNLNGNFSDYGSNATPLSINAQDEITISLTPYMMSLVTKLDANGGLIASKKISSADNPEQKNPGFSVIPTSDNGYLVTMKNGSNPTVTKLNSAFGLQWSKRWSIDNYSHPKTGIELPNGHFMIVGEGDLGTYMAEVDENGNVLQYKSGITLAFPYRITLKENDIIQVIDYYGCSYTTDVNLTSGTMKTTIPTPFGTQKFNGDERNLIDFDSNIYFNLDGTQKDCFTVYEQTISLFEIALDPNAVTDEAIIVENTGEISNYVPTVTTSNSVFLSENCTDLSVAGIPNEIGQLYPNPSATGTTVTLSLNNSKTANISITTAEGKILQTLSCNAQTLQFSLEQAAGIYFMRGYDSVGNLTGIQKIIIN